MSTELPPWPLDVSPEKTVLAVIHNCGHVPLPKSRARTMPRWSAVSKATAHGKGYSYALCRWAGLDPDQLVVPRR